jgi:hypothetical protein
MKTLFGTTGRAETPAAVVDRAFKKWLPREKRAVAASEHDNLGDIHR